MRQSPDYNAQIAIKVKRLVSMILYLIVYAVMLVLHIFVAMLSATAGRREEPGDNNYYVLLLALNIVICVISAICWCILVQNTSTHVGQLIKVFTNVQTNVLTDDWSPEQEEDAN